MVAVSVMDRESVNRIVLDPVTVAVSVMAMVSDRETVAE